MLALDGQLSRMRTRWVTFDCFGTLVDWNAGFAAALTPMFGARTAEGLRAYHEFERKLESERPHRLYKDVLAGALGLAAARLEVALTDEASQALQNSWARLPLFADVELMLAQLRADGYRLAVLTNCDDDLFAQTDRAFRRPFDLVITAEQVRAYKPSLAHFQRFSERSGATPKDWVHVACSWYHDIVPARAMGIPRIWLDRDRTGEDPAAASVRVTSAAEVWGTVRGL
jgi:2-haloacid dehalogenase